MSKFLLKSQVIFYRTKQYAKVTLKILYRAIFIGTYVSRNADESSVFRKSDYVSWKDKGEK